MRLRSALASSLLGIAAVTVLSAGPVAADPTNAKKGEILTVDCDVLGTLQIATNGNGDWTPGHVIGTTQVVRPYAFHFEFTPPGGPTFTEDISKPAPRHGRLDRCTFGDTDEEGTFSGIVWVSYSPAH